MISTSRCITVTKIVAMKDGRMIAHGLPEEIITKELVQEVYGVDLTIQSVDGNLLLSRYKG